MKFCWGQKKASHICQNIKPYCTKIFERDIIQHYFQLSTPPISNDDKNSPYKKITDDNVKMEARKIHVNDVKPTNNIEKVI